MIAVRVEGPWALDERADKCWGVINTVTKRRKKIGPIGERRANYLKRALEEVERRNVEHYKLTTLVEVCLECMHAIDDPRCSPTPTAACVSGKKWLSAHGKYLLVYDKPGEPSFRTRPTKCDCCQVIGAGPRYTYRRVKWNPRSPK